jgi:hypothetical protein
MMKPISFLCLKLQIQEKEFIVQPEFVCKYRTYALSGAAHAFLQQRMLSNLSKTAEERYEAFMSAYPKIAQSVPPYTLASCLV